MDANKYQYIEQMQTNKPIYGADTELCSSLHILSSCPWGVRAHAHERDTASERQQREKEERVRTRARYTKAGKL